MTSLRLSRARARHARLLPTLAALLALAGLSPATAHATHLTVTNTNDAFAGSLRQAVLDSSPGDSIVFDPATWGLTITLSSGQIAVSQSVVIVGPQKGLITVAASGFNRAFDVLGGQLTLAGLTLTNPGSSGADFGGLVSTANATAALVLTDCDLVHNQNLQYGGLLYNVGTTTAVRCRLSNGTSAGSPGSNGGAVYTTGPFTATDCLFDSSTASTGGAIYSSGRLRLVRCTFAGNTSGGSEAIYVQSGADSTSLLECTVSANAGSSVAVENAGAVTVDVGNTIIAGNAGGDVSGAFRSLGFNAIGIGTGSTGFGGQGSHDQVGTSGSPLNPNLGPLRDNGGPTLTLAPSTSSVLIVDQGHAMVGAVDARGHARTYDYLPVPNANGGDGTDVGAVEYNPATHWTVQNLHDVGPDTFRQAVITAAPNDTVSFDPSVGGTIFLSHGEVALNHTNLFVIGPGPGALILDGGGVRPVLVVPAGLAGTTIRGVQLTHGALTGALDTKSPCTLDLAAITDCRTSGIRNASALVVQRSLITGCNAAAPAPNQASNGGGIFNAGTGGVVLVNSTVAADTALNGGGISNGSATGFVQSYSSTIVGNVTVGLTGSSRHGGGIQNAGQVYLASTIVAGNTAELGGPDVLGSFTTSGYNWIGVGDGSTGLTDGANHDHVGTLASPLSPGLGPLADNGGPTLTMLPLAGSPVIDQGFANSFTTDQREFTRLVDDPSVTNGPGSDASDIGACERGASTVDVGPAPRPADLALVDRIDAVQPNPVVERCTVSFTLARAGAVDLALYDVAGRRVATLARGQFAAGPHALAFGSTGAGGGSGGARLAAGVYWLRLATPAGASARAVVRLR